MSTLDRSVALLSSVRGTDKVLMMIQYASKLIVWGHPSLTKRVMGLAAPVGDCRILLRFSGLIAMLLWIITCEKNPSSDEQVRLLTRLQNISNVLYYPLEHVYYLAAHDVIKLNPSNLNAVGMWSCRFWMVSTFLCIAQINREQALNKKEIRKLQIKDIKEYKNENSVRLLALEKNQEALLVNLVINCAYVPLTLVNYNLLRV